MRPRGRLSRCSLLAQIFYVQQIPPNQRAICRSRKPVRICSKMFGGFPPLEQLHCGQSNRKFARLFDVFFISVSGTI